MEKYKEKLEIEEMPNGTWQVREIKIYTYKDPLAARNKMENYISHNDNSIKNDSIIVENN